MEHRTFLLGENLARLPGLLWFAPRLDGSEVTVLDQIRAALGAPPPNRPVSAAVAATWVPRVPPPLPEEALDPGGRALLARLVAAAAEQLARGGARVAFAVPPLAFAHQGAERTAPMQRLWGAVARATGAPGWDFSALPLDPNLFRGTSHLAHAGRLLYAQALAAEVARAGLLGVPAAEARRSSQPHLRPLPRGHGGAVLGGPWQRARLALLLVAAALFYAWHHWPSVFLLLGTIAFNYAAALAIERRRSQLLLALAVAANLSTLAWFKYSAFAAESLRAAFALAGAALEVPRLSSWLPLGISFFTFQVVAYQVDVFRGEVPAERSLLRFAVFKCFFAQLVAGPIVRARDFLPQLGARRAFDAAAFHQGLFLVVAGAALKIGVADVLAQFVREAFAAPGALTTTGAWTGLYAFAAHLLADFWGYSTMAVGVGLLFGLDLPRNFDTPDLAASVQEFWRRWHMTLSRWFRDYLYVPLGGNRKAHGRNLLVTMAVAGLWHGAGWTFVSWGLCHGVWLAAERALVSLLPPLPRLLSALLVFHGVCLMWGPFRAPDLGTAGAYFARLLLPPYTADAVPGLLAGWLLGFALLHVPLARLLEERRFVAAPLGAQVALTVALALFVLAHAGAPCGPQTELEPASVAMGPGGARAFGLRTACVRSPSPGVEKSRAGPKAFGSPSPSSSTRPGR